MESHLADKTKAVPERTLLETPRLFLIGYTPVSMRYLFESLPKEETMLVLGHRNEAEFQNEWTKYQNGYASYNRSFLLFLLVDKESDKIIGRSGIHNWNKDHKRAELGYSIDDVAYRKKGLMREAVAAILDHAFCVLQLHRVEALVGAKNKDSLAIIGAFGFTQEGLLREHWWNGITHEDSLVFSLLKAEYPQHGANYDLRSESHTREGK